MLALLSRHWWVLVLRGVFAILFGVMAYTMPLATLAALVVIFGVYLFADGVFALISAIAGWTTSAWIMLLHGVIAICVGLLALFNPAITAVALLIYIAVWAIVAGVLQIGTAIALRRELTGEWWLAFSGLIGVAFGVLLMWHPGAGALAVLWIIATYAIVWGIALIIGGFEVRHARKMLAA